MLALWAQVMSKGTRIRPPGELFALAVASWGLGMAAYWIALFVLFSETPGADLIAVAGWSAVAFFPLLPTVYVPAIWVVRRFSARERRWPLAVLGVALAPLCVTVTSSLWGRVRFPDFSAENVLFALLFATAGGVFAAMSVSRPTITST